MSNKHLIIFLLSGACVLAGVLFFTLRGSVSALRQFHWSDPRFTLTDAENAEAQRAIPPSIEKAVQDKQFQTYLNGPGRVSIVFCREGRLALFMTKAEEFGRGYYRYYDLDAKEFFDEEVGEGITPRERPLIPFPLTSCLLLKKWDGVQAQASL